jgi:hypothetical protein
MYPVNLISWNDPSVETPPSAMIESPAPSVARDYAAPCAEEADRCKETKEKVREYMERRGIERRQNSRAPLHDPETIRKEIGWDMVERRKGGRRQE